MMNEADSQYPGPCCLIFTMFFEVSHQPVWCLAGEVRLHLTNIYQYLKRVGCWLVSLLSANIGQLQIKVQQETEEACWHPTVGRDIQKCPI